VVRGAAVERHELLREVLRDLGGTITADRMRRLNYLVDVERRDVWEVVGEFLDGLRKGWERTAAAGRREEGGVGSSPRRV
jgi:hypothetical protein